ncbi:restriction endonuclease subunit S [Actinomadura madurae]|uniref:restriction endonuclease subunit S n=1 Tax=Actinomadura madurae TaxID=1993 RepID=UPI002025E381|nr:restriction endonuclease subunit S [Actinomadura madurae]URM99337.1 restriction endonuclease subunit S [Actinomadura madurae]
MKYLVDRVNVGIVITPAAWYVPEGGVPALRGLNIEAGRIKRDDLVRISHEGDVANEKSRLHSGDIVVVRTGQAGAAAVVPPDLDGTNCIDLVIIRPGEWIDPRYLAYVLNSEWARRKIEQNSVGSIQSHFNVSAMKNLLVPSTGLEEQRRIADFLDAETARIDRLIQLREQMSSLLRQRERGLLDAEIDALAARYGYLPFRRSIRRIEQGTSPQCDNTPAEDGEWGVLKVSAVKRGRFLSDQNKRLPDELKPQPHYEVRDGDLLITRANTPALVGAAAVANRPRRRLMLSDKIFRVSVDPRMRKDYVALVAQGTQIRDLCAEASHGTSHSMANLKTDEIKQWPIPMAPLSEQEAFVRRFDDISGVGENLVGFINTQLRLLEERRRAVVTAAVTGELDVTTARGVSSM